jgi:hypothetical protein
MAGTARVYLILGALYLCVGMVLGIVMGIKQDFTLAPVHAHVNLVGFAGHSVLALALAVWPALGRDSLARAQFWTFVIGAPLLMVGIALSILMQSELIVIIGSILLLIGALLFLAMVVRLKSDA